MSEKTDNIDYTAVGIDFGTSTTVVTVRNYNYKTGMPPSDMHFMQFDDGNCLSTLIYEDNDGRPFFGKNARIKKSGEKKDSIGQLYENFKMKLVNDNTANEGKRLTQKFFEYIFLTFNKKRADLHTHDEARIYISYPVKWDNDIKQFMEECAKTFGFTNVQGVDEATAAIYASISNHFKELLEGGIIHSDKPVNAMMLDMGVGDFRYSNS